MPHAKRILSLAFWAFAFGVAGFLVRGIFAHGIETRFIILAFWLLAVALEFVIKPALGGRRDLVSLTLNCTAAMFAIIAMKWMIEGVHPWLR